MEENSAGAPTERCQATTELVDTSLSTKLNIGACWASGSRIIGGFLLDKR